MIKLALCGAHGTGKTTILNDIAKLLPDTPPLKKTLRTYWADHGVDDFEKLPKEVRTVFQKDVLLNQLRREDDANETGFITDRSVVDYWGYTLLSSDMGELDLKIYKALIQARLREYTHVIFTPVMFDAQNEHLRANVDSRKEVGKYMGDFLKESLPSDRYLWINKHKHSERMKDIKAYFARTGVNVSE